MSVLKNMSLPGRIINILKKHGRPESDIKYYEAAIAGHTLDSIKIVLLGQDPYKDPTKRTGLAFSYPPGMMATASVRDIIIAAIKGKGNHTDIDVDLIRNGDLTSWSEQGVFLLNVSPVLASETDDITVWYSITRNILTAIAIDNPVAIGILLGNKAQEYDNILPYNLKWSHPSRISTINNDVTDPRHWNYCDCFWKANEILIKNKIFPVVWSSVLYSPDMVTSPDLVVYGRHDKLWLFTDGGTTNNGKANAKSRWAFIIKDSYGLTVMSMVREFTENATNNVAELKAIYHGLEWLHAKPDRYKSAEIVSDSKYSIDAINVWYPQWVSKGILATKCNTELIGKIVKLTKIMPLPIKWTHTRGHQKAPKSNSLDDEYIWLGNSEVDKLCGY